MECDFHAGRYAKIVAGSAQTAEEYYWQTRAYNELARQAFSHLADLPPSAEVHELLAKIHFSQKSYAAAAKDWGEALKYSPENVYHDQGSAISIRAGRNDEAARHLLEHALKQSAV